MLRIGEDGAVPLRPKRDREEGEPRPDWGLQ